MGVENLYLPALTGKFSNWRYYQVIMPVREIVKKVDYDRNGPVYRVRSVSEVKQIYSEEISKMLQRVFDERRLVPLKNYLTKQSDRYLNNLTLAIYGGSPEWYPIGLSTSSLMEIDADKGQSYWEELSKSLGVIKLKGNEIIFVLDGQHRIMGMREAVKEDESILDQEVSVTLVSHKDSEEGRKTTRRLFTTVNRHAKPVSLGENILLDEDDLSAIIARILIQDYPAFKDKDIIALNKTANLNLPKDSKKFTTVIELYNVNEKLIPKEDVYPRFTGAKKNLVRVRPSDEVIEQYKEKIFKFWDNFFLMFPNATRFVENPEETTRNNGGPFSLRPIGQSIYTDFYQKLKKQGRENEISLIQKVPDNLADEFWHYVLWDPIGEKMTGSETYARNYLYYNLDLSLTSKQWHSLLKNYRQFMNDENVKLPEKIINL